MPTNVIMPQLGESVVEGTVTRWLKKVGDPVAEFDPLLEVSTDKVDTEVPAPASGIILKIFVMEGTTVAKGALLAVIGQPGERVDHVDDQTQPQADIPAISVGNPNDLTVAPALQARMSRENAQRYSPVVARMAAEHHIDLTKITGSGLGGRVTKKDVEAYLENQASQAEPAGTFANPAPANAMPEVPAWEQPVEGDLFKPTAEIFQKSQAQSPTSSTGPKAAFPAPTSASGAASPAGELLPLNTMRRQIADHMVRSKLQIAPHVTTVFEVDATRVMEHWQAHMNTFQQSGIRLTLTAYFVMALVKAAQAQPTLNSQWQDTGLFIHHVVHVGMAVALDDGLIVPVIRNAQDMNLHGIARHVSDLASRARSKALRPEEITGGTITLTNHGVSGSLLATPIINQPQSAIVGVGAIQKRVVVLEQDGADVIAIRPMLYVTLTFDHRVADGAIADGFLATFKRTLEQWV